MKSLYHGDCIEVILSLPATLLSPFLTYPPYHLTIIVTIFVVDNASPSQSGTYGAFSRASKGFMGKGLSGEI